MTRGHPRALVACVAGGGHGSVVTTVVVRNMERSLLLLSYLFPPRGGAGVQRALKFVKYLPEFGWKPLVVANGGGANDQVTTVQDQTLMRDLPQGSVVRYTRLTATEQKRFERFQKPWRQRLEPTDPMAWWVEPAVRTAKELLRGHSPSAIFVTMSPFTAAEAGIRLKRLTGLPLILDLRDPWALDETKVYPTRWHAWRDWKRMRKAMKAADLVIMNTSESARAVAEAFGAPARIVSLTNGFDGEDFAPCDAASMIQPAPKDLLRIVHTGMFHSDLAEVWDRIDRREGLLNRFKHARRPINLWTRTPRYLLKAMQRVAERFPEMKGKLELVLVGELSGADKRLIESSPAKDVVRMLGYQTHAQSVQWLQSADVLFLPLHTPLDGGAALIVPGKAYEYIGSGRPVLAMGPPGDMRRLVQECHVGDAIDGDDFEGAAEVLRRTYEAKRAGSVVHRPDAAAIARLERRELSRKLAEELDQTVGETSSLVKPLGQAYLPVSPRSDPAGSPTGVMAES